LAPLPNHTPDHYFEFCTNSFGLIEKMLYTDLTHVQAQAQAQDTKAMDKLALQHAS
jgi:hypothetical protein